MGVILLSPSTTFVCNYKILLHNTHTYTQFTYHPLTARVDTREVYLEQTVGKH